MKEERKTFAVYIRHDKFVNTLFWIMQLTEIKNSLDILKKIGEDRNLSVKLEIDHLYLSHLKNTEEN
jgi:hypothetical protein